MALSMTTALRTLHWLNGSMGEPFKALFHSFELGKGKASNSLVFKGRAARIGGHYIRVIYRVTRMMRVAVFFNVGGRLCDLLPMYLG